MSSPFVWFHHNGQKSKGAKGFYESVFAWKSSGGPAGMTMLAADAGPFAAIGSKEDRYGDREEWIPFVAVATKRAVSLGATLLREKGRGPAGEFSVVRDPGGAALALLIYRANPPSVPVPELEEKEALARHRALQADAAAREELHAVARLDGPTTARTVRARPSGHDVTDGPFIEAKEWLVGFYLVDCENEGQAIEGLALLERSDIDANAYPYVHLVRGTLLAEAGRIAAAAASFGEAISCARNEHERRQIEQRISRLARDEEHPSS
jgi:predicted enzyme related to lactoylglutathione lyase